MPELFNGGVYRRPWHSVFTLVYIDGDRYGMLHVGPHRHPPHSCPSFHHDETGEYVFSEAELRDKFGADDWVLLDGRLRVEKMDWGMSACDYPLGGALDPLAGEGKP